MSNDNYEILVVDRNQVAADELKRDLGEREGRVTVHYADNPVNALDFIMGHTLHAVLGSSKFDNSQGFSEVARAAGMYQKGAILVFHSAVAEQEGPSNEQGADYSVKKPMDAQKLDELLTYVEEKFPIRT